MKQRSYKLNHNEATRSYFYCHRTGYFKSQCTGKCRINSQGSNKIYGICTSSLVVTENHSDITVVYHKTHYGHSSDLRRCCSTTEERAMLAGKISDAVSFDNLLDQICDNVENLFDPMTFATQRDFLNTQRDYDYHLIAGRQRSLNYISVKVWIERMKELAEDNPIIY